jgi:hypothetical protein
LSFFFVAGLEYNRNRYTQNTDFLLHEGGVNQPKKNEPPPTNIGNSQSSRTTSTKSDFPPLPSPSTLQTTPHPNNDQQKTRTTQSSGKRDYVASNYPPLKPPVNSQNGNKNSPTSMQPLAQPTQSTPSTGKRDYVAPNYPPLRPPSNTQHSTTGFHTNPPPTQGSQTSGRRDYVNPNIASNNSPNTQHSTTGFHTSPTPTQASQTSGRRDYVNPNIPSNNSPTNSQQGKVKDLINFYDSRNPQTSNPQKVPSYSSILQGTTNNNNNNNNNQGPTVNPGGTGTTKPPNQTPKPLSFSNVVSGSTNHASTITTRPSTNGPSNIRPSKLPSSIANNNKNQGNNGNSVTDSELQVLSEELLRKDSNNAAKYITINYQGKTTSQSIEDKAPLP